MQNQNWSPFVRAQHWLAFSVMAICVAAVWSHEAFPKGDPTRTQLMQLHFLLGVTIAILVIPRLLTRLFVKAPVHEMTPLVTLLSKAGHLGLYLLMIAVPVGGYLAVSGRGNPIDILGLVSVPPAPISKDVAEVFGELHEGLANGLLILIGIHAAAAIFHAVVLKDKVLHSMLGVKQ